MKSRRSQSSAADGSGSVNNASVSPTDAYEKTFAQLVLAITFIASVIQRKGHSIAGVQQTEWEKKSKEEDKK